MDELKITRHFLERISERVLGLTNPIKCFKVGKKELKRVMSTRQKINLDFFVHTKGIVKIPTANHTMIVRDGVAVTIY
tara:strand:+ start:50 stop:283 length:234 start_codon:yes stop_codon:yes gene_type:complete